MTKKELLDKLIECIEDELPSEKYYTDEAYNKLIDNVLREVFGEKIQEAVSDAKDKLNWNSDIERYE